MGIKEREDLWKCDICGLKVYEPQAKKDPKWVKFVVDTNSATSNSAKAICGYCLQAIMETQK